MNFYLRTFSFSAILASILLLTAHSAQAQCELTNHSFNNITPTSAVCSWNETPTAYKYEYFVTPDLSSIPPTGKPGSVTTSTSIVINGLTPDQTWYVCVRAYCTSGTSQWVCESFKTPDPSSVNTVTKQPEFTITAYPNPATDKLNIVLPEQYNGRGNIIVTSLLGSVVAQTNTFGRYAHVSLSGMAPGLYLVKYTDGVNTKTIKVNKL